jgi:hypothetical protein
MNLVCPTLLALTLPAGAMTAHATTMRLDVATTDSAVATDHYVMFIDTGDGVFSLPELTYFSTASCHACADGH